MTTTKEISAAEWLKVREQLARSVKAGATANTQFATCRNIAEHLLEAELVDIDAILKKIRPQDSDESVDAELVDKALADARTVAGETAGSTPDGGDA